MTHFGPHRSQIGRIGGELLASHDGFDVDDLDEAREWAAALLLNERGHCVTGWRTRPSRHDPEAIEHAAITS